MEKDCPNLARKCKYQSNNLNLTDILIYRNKLNYKTSQSKSHFTTVNKNIRLKNKNSRRIFPDFLNNNLSRNILLVFLIFCLTVSAVTSEEDYNNVDYDFQLEESGTDYRTKIIENPTQINEQENSEVFVKAFLAKFGYLQPADWNGISPRFINSGFGILSGAGDLDLIEEEFFSDNQVNDEEGSGEVEITEDRDEVVVYKPTYDHITEEEYQEALMKYQRANGLLMTGELDTDTKEFMEQPRCGVPDRTATLKSNITLIASLPEKTNAGQVDSNSTTTESTLPLTRAQTSATTKSPTTTNAATNSPTTTNATTKSPTTTNATTKSPTTTNATTNSATTTNATTKSPATTNATTKSPAATNATTKPPTTTNATTESPTTTNATTESSTTKIPTIEYVTVTETAPLITVKSTESFETNFKAVSSGDEETINFDENKVEVGDNKDLNNLVIIDRKRRSTENWEAQIRVGFEEHTEDEDSDIFEESENMFLISEAEPPEESRVKSLEDAWLALRNATLQKQQAKIVEQSPQPLPPTKSPDLIHRAMLHARRKKRSYLVSGEKNGISNSNGWLMPYAKSTITWRLVREWPSTSRYFSSQEVWFTIKLAFRMWSEVLPRMFVEDTTSPMSHVDILLGFGKRRHNRCPVEFMESAYTNEYAHAWPLPKAEVHFNDDQPFRTFGPMKYQFSTVYDTPIDLLMVALHEIGHALGLPHTKDNLSIMNPVYRPYKSSRSIELAYVDRNLIQKIYGKCEISFDVVFDWVRPFQTSAGKKFKYNSFFFRKTWYWLYENKVRRPRYGDPKSISKSWEGLLEKNDPYGKIDAIIQIRGWTNFAGPTFIFKGNIYMEIDSATEKVKKYDSNSNPYPRKISDGFPGIPYPIDTAIYKYDERLLYFFKGDKVYKFNFAKKVVVSSNYISLEFPGWGGASPLPSNLNAAYYSYSDYAYYFFKGDYYWRMADKRDRMYNKGEKIPQRAVGPRQKITAKWRDLCDVHSSELDMKLPGSL